MISSGFATVIAVIVLSTIAVAAIVMGFIVTGVLGMDWSVRTGLADALVALTIYVACALALSALRRDDGVVLIFSSVAAVLSGGVLRHVGRRLRGRANRAPAA